MENKYLGSNFNEDLKGRLKDQKWAKEYYKEVEKLKETQNAVIRFNHRAI